MRRWAWLWTLLLALVLVQVVLSVFPLRESNSGRTHSNPPVRAEPPWDTPRTRALFFQACGDCHSNETRWPWYSFIPPFSWVIQWDVEKGRAELNVSEWNGKGEAKEMVETIRKGSMPPRLYLALHPSARLSPQDQEALIAGIIATFGLEEEAEDEEYKEKKRKDEAEEEED